MKGTTYLTLAAAKMSEAELEAEIAKACKQLGLRYYHTHRSQHSPSGFPDDVIVGPHGMVYRENKRQTGKVSTAQQEWLDDLAAQGCDVGVWRPLDWLDGTITATLVRLRYGSPRR